MQFQLGSGGAIFICSRGSNSSRERLFEEKVGRGDVAESARVE